MFYPVSEDDKEMEAADPDADGYVNRHGLSRKVGHFAMSRVFAQYFVAAHI